MLAVVDCNNFYVSCQQMFEPKFKGKPVVVLSNNDGCTVSRSNEAKAIGVKMGEPWFKIKERFGSQVKAFSANFALYGDMSDRVMSLLRDYSDKVETYSIDEAFVDLDHIKDSEIESICKEIVERCNREIGIPISIGIANSKTLAKCAVEVVKDRAKNGDNSLMGVFKIDETNREQILSEIYVGDIWNVGYSHRAVLIKHRIENGLTLAKTSPMVVKGLFGNKEGENLVLELLGQRRYLVEQSVDSKKGIMASRSFGHEIHTIEDLKQAIALNCVEAISKLRKEKLYTNYISVYFCTDRFKPYKKSFYLSRALDHSINSEIELVKVVHSIVDNLYEPNYPLKKSGVSLMFLSSQKHSNLFDPNPRDYSKANEVVEKLKRKFGNHSIKLGSTIVTNKHWLPISEMRSPRYTTVWGEVMVVR